MWIYCLNGMKYIQHYILSLIVMSSPRRCNEWKFKIFIRSANRLHTNSPPGHLGSMNAMSSVVTIHTCSCVFRFLMASLLVAKSESSNARICIMPCCKSNEFMYESGPKANWKTTRGSNMHPLNKKTHRNKNENLFHWKVKMVCLLNVLYFRFSY